MIVLTPEKARGLESAFDEESPFETGLLLHGFGATAEDLIPLARSFPVRRKWIFPQAPQELRWGGSLMGRAWFPRRQEELESAMSGAYFAELSERDPDGLASSAAALLELLQQEGVRLEESLVGGFSQGAMVSVELLLQAPAPVKGALLFSAALLARSRWTGSAPETSGPGRFVQSHGSEDTILPYEEGRALYELLDGSGWRGGFLSFRGGHEIPRDVVAEAKAALYEPEQGGSREG